MYGSLSYNISTSTTTPGKSNLDRKAAYLFSNEQRKARIQGLVARFLGRTMRMLDLQEIRRQNPKSSRSFLGNRSVPIDRIRGSESRCDDFDSNLRPLGDHNRQRWISVAVALLSGVNLPPVELIHVGGFYFVRDGHHRISVARALGELFIDAQVLNG